MTRRLEYLDSVRGLAALSVLFSHYNLSFGLPKSVEKLMTNTPLHIWWDGFAAVSLFFVLSGFVLSIRFFGEGKIRLAEFNYRKYTIARFFRIWLPYFFVFVSSLLIWLAFKRSWTTLPPQSEWFHDLWNDFGTPLNLFQESALVLRGGHAVVPQAWTLTVELIVSLFVPLGARIASIHAIWIFIPEILVMYFLKNPLFLIHFALGILLAKIYCQRKQWLRENISRGFWPILGVGLLLYTFRFSVAPYFPSLVPKNRIWYFTGIGSFVILACIVSNDRIQNILNHDTLRFLGRISYSLYLCHFAVIIAFAPAFISFMNSAGIRNANLAWLLGLVATLAVTLAASTIVERWIEKPSIQLGKWLARP
ncbi:MAG: acyltransferase [Oligoflexia bacterium]|nr:acyltransferase [Oligoflexia bacterium]